NADRLRALSDNVWAVPETCYGEHKSVALHIEELEAQLQSHEEGSTNNTKDVLETKIEVLLAALLDLEREVSSIGDVKDGRELD
ncbi:MAG: hypothetical protein ACPGJA_00005, partial [Candidatus Thalassarchaeaceae archaeon]